MNPNRLAEHGMIAKSQANRTTGHPLRSLQLNLAEGPTSNPLVREALILAYDFDGINSATYSNRLKRPLSLLYESSFEPSGAPSSYVSQITSVCVNETPKHPASAFETYGNSIYDSMHSHRSRLIAAQARLIEAGYKMVDGRQQIDDRESVFLPLNLTLLILDSEDRAAFEQFRLDLASLGIKLTIVQATSPADFKQKMSTNSYSMYVNRVTMLNADGRPDAVQFRASTRYSSPSPCINRLLNVLRTLNPLDDSYRYLAEGIARAHQAIGANIFLGEPRFKEFTVDSSLDVPPGLLLERMHMYGFSVPDQFVQ